MAKGKKKFRRLSQDENKRIWGNNTETDNAAWANDFGANADDNESEFPSLSGGPQQSQIPNNIPQAWNSTALRQAQQPQAASLQRPQNIIQNTQRAPSTQPLQQQQQGLQQESSSQFGSSLEGQYDGQSAVQRPTNNTQEEFPPLGGLPNGDGNRQGVGQGLGAFPGSDRPGQTNGQGVAVPSQAGTDGTDGVTGVQSPTEQHRSPSGPPSNAQQFTIAQRDGTNPLPSLSQSQPNGVQGTDSASLASPRSTTQQALGGELKASDMTEAQRFGLEGLRHKMASGSPLVYGMDLDGLGLELSSQDPLFQTWSSPFGDPTARPMVPDFNIPSAYIVNNVPPLRSRLNAFSDETLFAIFYQNPRDMIQEDAAAELYSRDWRWHIKQRRWMMKDAAMPQPVRISDRAEQGVYVFFDAENWRRERRQFVLDYDDLDQRHQVAQPPAAL